MTVSPSFGQACKIYLDLARGVRWKLGMAVLHLAVGVLGYWFFCGGTGMLVDTTLQSMGVDLPPTQLPTIPGGIDRIGVILLGVAVVVLWCSYIDMAWFIEVGERAAARLRERLFGHLVQLPMGFFDDARVGDLSSRVLADVAILQEMWTNDLRNVLKHGMLVFGSVLLMFFVSWKLSMFVLATAPFIAVATAWSARRIRRDAGEGQDRLAKSSVILEETMGGIRDVKFFSTESHQQNRFKAALADYLQPAVRMGKYRSSYLVVVLAVMFCAIVALMWFGSRQIAARDLSPGELTSFMFLIALASSSGGMLAELAGRLQKSIGATARIFSMQSEAGEAVGNAENQPGIVGHIQFRDVSFSYGSRTEKPALEGVNLEFLPGKKTALVGPSGGGKSTIVSLLFRLYEPANGVILLDGRPISEYPLGFLRRQFAVVPQMVTLFHGTVAENIGYGRLDAERAEIEQAAREANAWEFIEKLPQGLDTPIGDRGSHLSGGQRQRIAIARALLRDPKFLILDEAVSALDSENARLVEEALERLMQGRSTLVIAHRLASIRDADQIFVMNNGQVVESGDHEALMNAAGLYRALYETETREGDFRSDPV